MEDKAFQFLKELIEAPSPSGFEQPAQRVLRKHLDGLVDSQTTDVMGNLISRIDADRPDAPRVMLAGHCDEIGLGVCVITSGIGYSEFINGSCSRCNIRRVT